MNQKIGPIRMSGLMIGPILGSGVILLPPLAYSKLGSGSLWAWIIIMALGALFALLFTKLSVMYPGDGGMTIAIEKAFGQKWKLYASFLMISAVTFGPSAVMLTAADYLVKLKLLHSIHPSIIAMLLICTCFLMLQRDLKFISTLSFVLSTLIAVVLTISSIRILTSSGISITPIQSVNPTDLGGVVLLLFWAIIGWEVIGNYSTQVKDPEKTIPKATIMSLIAITGTYLVIALAFQSFEFTQTLSLVDVLTPTFAGYSAGILALLVTGLCICTYMLIVGALSRLVHSLSVEGFIPEVFINRNENGVPINALKYFSISHMVVLSISLFNIFDIEIIVSIANGFFLANAVIGLLAAAYVINNPFYKISGVFLSVSLLFILGFSSKLIFVALVTLYLLVVYLSTSKTKVKKAA